MTNQNKEAKASKSVKVGDVEANNSCKSCSATSSIVLAFSLIGIGVLLVLNSLGLIDFRWWNLFQLWPLLLILCGLSILSNRGFIWRVLAVTGQVAILVFAFLVAAGILERPAPTNIIRSSEIQSSQTTAPNKSATDLELAKIDIKAARNLQISAGDQTNAHIEYSGPTAELKQEKEDGKLKFELDFKRNALDSDDNPVVVKLAKNAPLELDIDFGAGKINADLRGLKLSKLDIDSGASDIEIFLDSVDQKIVSIDLDLGVSNVKLNLPNGCGIKLNSDSGLSSINATGLEPRGKGYFESPNLADASVIYEIKLDSGLSNFELKYF